MNEENKPFSTTPLNPPRPGLLESLSIYNVGSWSSSVDSFSGEYRWLSNFWLCHVEYAGIEYISVEHAFQALKMAEPSWHVRVKNAPTPGEAKRLGRMGKMKFGWDDVKMSVMQELLISKFRNQTLRTKLLATGNARLIEGNAWGDRYWGVCRGVGENNLGKLLMKVRDMLRAEPTKL